MRSGIIFRKASAQSRTQNVIPGLWLLYAEVQSKAGRAQVRPGEANSIPSSVVKVPTSLVRAKKSSCAALAERIVQGTTSFHADAQRHSSGARATASDGSVAENPDVQVSRLAVTSVLRDSTDGPLAKQPGR